MAKVCQGMATGELASLLVPLIHLMLLSVMGIVIYVVLSDIIWKVIDINWARLQVIPLPRVTSFSVYFSWIVLFWWLFVFILWFWWCLSCTDDLLADIWWGCSRHLVMKVGSPVQSVEKLFLAYCSAPNSQTFGCLQIISLLVIYCLCMIALVVSFAHAFISLWLVVGWLSLLQPCTISAPTVFF